jgi:simple sugar transport system permease protein
MTTTTAEESVSASLETATIKSWKAPIAYAIFSLIAIILFVVNGRDGTSRFRLSSEADVIQLPVIDAPTRLTCVVVVVLLLAITAYATWLSSRAKRVPLWLTIIFAAAFMWAFLTWAAAGESIPITGLLLGTVALSAPLIGH